MKPVDRTPRTYDRKTFKLHGRMDLDISFGDRTINTPINIKMDAHDQLLLSEGVCRLLNIISYHPDVQVLRKVKPPDSIQVHLVESVRIPPNARAMLKVSVTPYCPGDTPLLLEREGADLGVWVDASPRSVS